MVLTIKDLTVAEMQLLNTVYENLVEAGLVLATIDQETFIEAALTGDGVSYE